MPRIAYYYDTKLSDNIVKQEDTGFLICKDVVIGRTGFQEYKGSELPRDQLEELGISVGPDDKVSVYRPAEEVFHPEAMASFEGATLTDGHPPRGEFIDSDNIKDLGQGHLQNVHKGEEPLDSGDWPLLADAVITHSNLIHKVDALGRRELSGGYDYNLGLKGGKLIQKDIRGNHVAVVPKGRAGAEARINDSALPEPETQPAPKEQHHVAKNNVLKHLFGLGLKAFAVDANPEELAEAAEAVKDHGKPAADAEEVKPEVKPIAEVKVEPKKDEARDRLHKALDKVLDCKKAEDAKSEDVDIEELKDLLGEYLDEEEEEPQHEEDEEQDEEEEVEDESDDPDAEEEERESALTEHAEHAEDTAAFAGAGGVVHPIRGSKGYKRSAAGEPPKKRGRKKAKAKDALLVEPIAGARRQTATDVSAAAVVLKMLRPGIARSKDAQLHRAFDAACEAINRSAKKSSSNGSYGAIARAATARATDAGAPQSEQAQIDMANAAYKERFRKNPSEVK